MTVYELVAKLGAAGIKLWVENAQLKFKAPKGALTPELKQQLIDHKADVIEFLSSTKVTDKNQMDSIPLADRSQPLMLSYAQQRLWFVEQLSPDSSTFHIPVALYLNGMLDHKALEAAFVDVIQRHEALRTVFVVENDQPYQQIQLIDRFSIALESLLDLPQAEREPQAKILAEREIRKPFDLSQGPLIRAKLFHLDDNRHALVVTMHHIISDGWSMGVFVKEITACYASRRMGVTAPFDPLSIQYADFSQWQREWLQGEVLERQLNYWREQLRFAPESITLPFDRPRPALQSSNGSTIDVEISKPLADKVRKVARAFDCTAYVVLMAAYNIVLFKWSKQNDLCVGIPIAGRTRPEVEGLIGFFVNSLVVRTQLIGNPTFAEYITELKELVLGAQTHQDVPFEAIVDAVDVPRNLSVAPLAQVSLSVTGAEGIAQKSVVGGLEVTPMPVDLIAARLDLSLMLADHGEFFKGIAEYNTDLFDAVTIERFVQHFYATLESISENSEQFIKTFSLETEESLRLQLNVTGTVESILPLTPIQKDQCQHDRNIGYAICLPFDVDDRRWKSALCSVVSANPALRIQLAVCNQPGLESIYQVVQPSVNADLTVLDWCSRSLCAEALDAQLQALIHENSTSTTQPNYFLVRSKPQECWAVFSVPSALWSLSSCYEHAAQVMSAYQGNTPDLIEWQRLKDAVYDHIHTTNSTETIQYWQKSLSACEPLSGKQQNPGDVFSEALLLDVQELSHINDYCGSKGLTVVDYVRALFSLALQRCFYHPADFVLMDSTASINHKQVFFPNHTAPLLPIVISVENHNHADVLTVIKKQRQLHATAQTHGNISFDELNRTFDNSALTFEFHDQFSCVELLRTHHTDTDVGVRVWSEGQAGVVKLALLPAKDKALQLNLTYCSNEFKGQNLLRRIHHVHQQIMFGKRSVIDLDWLSDDEKSTVPCAQYGASFAITGTFLHDLERHVKTQPDHCAVACGAQSLSYQSLDRLSNQLANWLLSQNVSLGSNVAICVSRSVTLPVAYLGVIKSNAAYIPLDSNYPQDRIHYILNDSKASVLITESAVVEKIQATNPTALDAIKVLLMDDLHDSLKGVSEEKPGLEPGLDDILYYVYTSGSTGKPKGAGVYHRGEKNLLNWYQGLLNCTSTDRVLLMSAIGFDLTQKNIFIPLFSGATLVIPEFDEYDPAALLTTIDTHKVSVINCAPSAFYPLVENAIEFDRLLSLRHVVLGGEPIRMVALSDWLHGRHNTVVLTNSYGPTECTDVVASYSISSDFDDLAGLPIGKPIANTQLHIGDQSGQPLLPGIAGELYIAGVGVGAGYLNNPELTQTAFHQYPFGDGRWYRTGDICRIDENGNLVYQGRADHQLKLRGLRIEPGEIETLLKAGAGVDDALCVVTDDILVGYVLAQNTIDLDALKQSLSQQLPDYMVPAMLVKMQVWPLTPNGKIDRKALPSPQLSTEANFVAPRNSSESLLASIWCQVLKRDQVSVTSNFFELGGHSLLATQVISQIRKEFSIELSVRTLFEAPTIEKLVRAISAAANSGWVDQAPALEPAQPPNRTLLSFAQHRLWFVDQLNQGSSEYNLPAAIRIKGALNVAVLDQVFGEIVARHEVLRTNFGEHEGEPQLIVHEPMNWHSRQIDVSTINASAQAIEIKRLIDDDASRVYSLATDPLFSSSLIKVSDHEHILLLNMHHIISDGWSLGVLVQEIQALYPAYLLGHGSPLPPLPVQYSDFAVWQRQWLQGETLDKLRAYWQQALRGAPDVLRLPTDKPRPKHQTFNGAHYPVDLGVDMSQRLNQFCAERDLTPFMVLMAAYHIMLSRYTNQNDICVGIPIAGRNRVEVESLIGFFINGLVIRSRLDGNPTALEYLQQIKETALGAYAHQDMPADLLIDAIKMERTADTSPGAQIGFALQNTAQQDVYGETAGLIIESVAREHKTAKYELSLILQEADGSFSGIAEYNTDLFEPESIGRMMAHFQHVLNHLLADPDVMLESLPLYEFDALYSLLDVDPNVTELRPLSPMQTDMVLDALVEPNSLKNSLGYHFITSGKFDPELWQQALQKVTDEQPLLRARILCSDLPYTDVAYLAINNHQIHSFQFEGWSDRAISDEQAAAHAQQWVWQPYDIKSTLSFSRIVKLNDHRHMVVFRMNHILLDGAGMAVHLNNVVAAAQALSGQSAYHSVPDIFPQYVKDNRQRTDSTSVLRHWRDQGASVGALDYSLPNAVAQPTRIEKNRKLPDQHWQSIQSFCKENKLTPSLYFKALYGMLINAYCRGEDDFVISEVVGGRVGQQKRAFGNYFQVVPVVFQQNLFEASQSVDALLTYIRQYRKNLRANASVSLMMQRRLLPQGRLNFMFNYYNFIPAVSVFGTEVNLKAYPQIQDGPVQFVVQEQGSDVEWNLMYQSDLFDDHRFLERMEVLSQQILSGQHSIGQLQLLLPDEQPFFDQMLKVSPSSSKEGSDTVVSKFIRQAQASPDTVAVQCGQQQLTYRELDQLSTGLAAWLEKKQIGAGARVGICLDRSVDMLVAVFGVLKSGAAYVPMDSNYPAQRLAYILNDAASPVLLTQCCVHDKLKEQSIDLSGADVLELDVQREWMTMVPEKLALPRAEDPIYVIYTSGSTGQPKGAMIAHSGEINLQQWYIDSLGITATDKFLLMSAFGFDLTQKNLFAPMLVGGTLVIPEMDDYDVDVIAQTIDAEHISIVNCAPSAFYPLLENTQSVGYPFPALRYVVLGGEPIRMETLKPWLLQSSCKVVNSYGPTECSDVVAYHIHTDQDLNATGLPIGKPITNTQLFVVDQAGHLLPQGIVGELCIAGAGVGFGYINRDELTQSVFQNNPFNDGRWYRTGDLVRFRPDGLIEYVGRKDHQVKLRGLRIELGEIDAALKQQPTVKDALTLVVDDRLIGYVLSAVPVDGSELKQSLRQRLPDYMIPASVVVLDQWPLTPNGKIDRKALPVCEESDRPAYVAPRSETEEKLVAIWAEILGVEPIGVHDNFFDLGGHSLLAARAVSKFRQVFEVDIQLRALFELHTVADIAQYLDTLQWATQSAERSKASAEPEEGREEGFL